LQQLKAAGLIEAARGTGGVNLEMMKKDYLRLLVDKEQGEYIDWRNFL